ncbi:MAG TPA: tRNA (adenosine(37)-N6)-dimethylallyltransferase MiaA [Clostridiales bacterium]|nr:tRNA (adenosine(37)-N6)-dimethylallyltransferase MiaA [Clostridiales bacterium]
MYDSIIILGATACGKTDISIKLAKKLNTEIINADSLQIYKYLNIGTAKVTLAEQDGIQHHLLDFVEPTNQFSVAEYKSMALPIIKNLISNKKIPIIVGGTGFYVQSLILDNNYGNSYKSEELRLKLNQLAQKKGNMEVYKLLENIDPESAKVIHPNDLKKVIRAIEIYKLSGQKKSELKRTMQTNMQSPINPLIIVINRNRDELYDRINKRVDMMVKNGLIDEIKYLINERHIGKENQCMQAIGYKEFLDYIDGTIDLSSAIEKVKLNTRHYAKRQLTWFKNQLDALWINLSETSQEDAINIILNAFYQ